MARRGSWTSMREGGPQPAPWTGTRSMGPARSWQRAPPACGTRPSTCRSPSTCSHPPLQVTAWVLAQCSPYNSFKRCREADSTSGASCWTLGSVEGRTCCGRPSASTVISKEVAVGGITLLYAKRGCCWEQAQAHVKSDEVTLRRWCSTCTASQQHPALLNLLVLGPALTCDSW